MWNFKIAAIFWGAVAGVFLGSVGFAGLASSFSKNPNDTIDHYVMYVAGMFACAGAYLGYRLGTRYEESQKCTVPPGMFVYRQAGRDQASGRSHSSSIFMEGERYMPMGWDSNLSLGPRIVYATYDSRTQGIDDRLYMEVTYVPDRKNLSRFIAATEEASKYGQFSERLPKLDEIVGRVIAAKLPLSTKPDFSDLSFQNVENAYGITIISKEAKPRPSVERETERLSTYERQIKSQIATIPTLQAAAAFLIAEIKKAEVEPDLRYREFMLDILQRALDNIKLT
jgi:hypothetical protein